MIHQWSLMIVNGAYKPTYGTKLNYDYSLTGVDGI